MRHKDWLVRMEQLRSQLEEYVGPRVSWSSDEQGQIYFNLTATAYQTCPSIGPCDPDEIAEAGTDDAAHALLMLRFRMKYLRDFHEVGVKSHV